MRPDRPNRARLTVLSGPSGVAAGTVVREVRGRGADVWVPVACTTRRPRPGETDGVEYLFRTEDAFTALVEAGDLLEWAHHAGTRYGTPGAPVRERLAAGGPVLLAIDLQGARQVRAAMPEAQLVFLAPPAAGEPAAAAGFDTVVVNDDIRRAAAELVRLVSSAT